MLNGVRISSNICSSGSQQHLHTWHRAAVLSSRVAVYRFDSAWNLQKPGDCVRFVWQFETLPWRVLFFYLLFFSPPTARAVQLYEVCQHYQLRGSLQSKHSDCRVILKKREATIERQELERGRAIERACGKWKHGGEKSTRLSGGGVEFDSERGRQKGGRERGCQTRKRDFNVSKDFPITVADTLHTQLTISRTLTAAQIGWKRFPGQGLWSGVGVYVCPTLCCVSR